MKSPEELSEIFRAKGLKITPQRQAIFQILYNGAEHPTAEAVYAKAQEQMPTMSLRTVYQTLNDLAEMGEITQLDLGTGSARFDTNLDSHQHLVCSSCGEVRDIAVDFTDFEFPGHLLNGFSISSTDVVFRGHCANCANAEAASLVTSNHQA